MHMLDERLAQLVSRCGGLGGTNRALTSVLQVDGGLRAGVRQLADLNHELKTKVFELEIQMQNRVRAP